MNALTMTRDERIEALISTYGPNCFYPGCGQPFQDRTDITFDHWIPQARGGTWEIENLRLMHKRCNAIKGDRMPNPDGSLPPLKREVGLANRRAVRRGIRPELCGKCDNGRLLGPQESCNTCGSGPMPERWPRWAKVKASECDHDLFWCWACGSGVTERKAVINGLLDE